MADEETEHPPRDTIAQNDSNLTPNSSKEIENNESDNGWWKSWYSTAKAKSGEVFNYLKEDLTEISSTVKSEATNFLSNASSAIATGIQVDNVEWTATTNSVKDSVTSIISQVGQVLSPMPADDDEEPYIVENDKVVSISKLQSKLYLLSADPNTYLNDIEGHLKSQYNAWLESLKTYEFDQMSNETLTKLLLKNSRLKENYEKFVPDVVSHGDFWHRFLFRKALLEDDEAENERKRSVEKKLCDKLQWNEESFGTHVALSEEEQGQILENYEKERSVGDKVIPSNSCKNSTNLSNSEVSSVQSVNDRESSSDDWEKDFDIDEINGVLNQNQ